MKISIEIEKDSEDKGMDQEEIMQVTAFQRKVAKMLAKMAGRNTPNEIDMETAKDFEEDNAEYGGMKK